MGSSCHRGSKQHRCVRRPRGPRMRIVRPRYCRRDARPREKALAGRRIEAGTSGGERDQNEECTRRLQSEPKNKTAAAATERSGIRGGEERSEDSSIGRSSVEVATGIEKGYEQLHGCDSWKRRETTTAASSISFGGGVEDGGSGREATGTKLCAVAQVEVPVTSVRVGRARCAACDGERLPSVCDRNTRDLQSNGE